MHRLPVWEITHTCHFIRDCPRHTDWWQLRFLSTECAIGTCTADLVFVLIMVIVRVLWFCVCDFVILVWIVRDSSFQNDINDEYSSANSTTNCWRRSTSSRIFDENSGYKFTKVSVMCVRHKGTYRECRCSATHS